MIFGGTFLDQGRPRAYMSFYQQPLIKKEEKNVSFKEGANFVCCSGNGYGI
jgi:hypothetical protein